MNRWVRNSRLLVTEHYILKLAIELPLKLFCLVSVAKIEAPSLKLLCQCSHALEMLFSFTDALY